MCKHPLIVHTPPRSPCLCLSPGSHSQVCLMREREEALCDADSFVGKGLEEGG